MLARTAIIFAALSSAASATDITYQFVAIHGTGQSGSGDGNGGLTGAQTISPTLTGSITTDGKLGSINASDILSWNISAGNGLNSSSGVTPFIGGQITATPTALEFGTTSSYLSFNLYYIPTSPSAGGVNITLSAYDHGVMFGSSWHLNAFGPAGHASGTMDYTSPAPLVFASNVPEPSTFILAALGGLALLAMRRQK